MKWFTEQNPVLRQIAAHLHTAQRHIERGEYAKAEQHLLAATQHAEQAGLPHFGRWSLQQFHRREAEYAERERLRDFKSGQRR